MTTDLSLLFKHLGIALGLGLLVGLQRQRAHAEGMAGVRTFALVTVSGALFGHLAAAYGGWMVAAGVVALTGLMVVANLHKIKSGALDPGLTTEVAMLLMYGVGAFLAVGPAAVSIVVGGAVAVLLYLKPQLHGLAAKVGESDFRAIMQFALISLVILPVLPNTAFGPYGVLVPRQIWWMVVLIVGLGLAGYVAYKLLGHRGGTLLAGVLGGVISSTATTVSQARRARGDVPASDVAALVVVLASGTVFVRLLIEVAAVAPGFLPTVALPLGGLLLLFALLALLMWRRGGETMAAGAPAENPSELKPALIFAVLYAAILLAVEAARRHFGSTGLYMVAALSGATDMDAITLSTAQLVKDGRLEGTTGAKLIVLASLSNLLFKTGIVAVLGNRRMLLRVGLVVGLAVAAGVFYLVVSP